MHLLVIIYFLGSFCLCQEDVRNVFNNDHPFMIGHVPSHSPIDPVMDSHGLPGMFQEIKINLSPGSYQCFYQNVLADSKLFVFFEILKGSNSFINVDIIQPNGVALKSFFLKKEGDVDVNITMSGIYGICLDNRVSQLSNLIVSLYLHTYFENQWEEIQLNMEESFSSVSKLLASFSVIDEHVKKIVTLSRFDANNLMRDWYLTRDNNIFVQRASIFLCIFFVVVSCLQTMFVKKLFSTPAIKPRV